MSIASDRAAAARAAAEIGAIDLEHDDANGDTGDIDADWPTLVSLNAPDLPSIDLDWLPGWVANFCRAMVATAEVPPELPAGMALSVISTACARSLRVIVRPNYFEPCVLWILAVLASACRKSGVLAAASAPLLKWERGEAEAIEPEIKSATSKRKTLEARANVLRGMAAKEKKPIEREALEQECHDIEASLPGIPTVPQLWTSDATPEKLGVLLADNNECLAWLSSEGGLFDLLAGRYSSGIPNLDLILKAHSGDAERVDRGSRPPVFLHSPRLTVGLSPQPAVLQGLAGKPGFRGRGLLARFLYLLPPSLLGHRPWADAHAPPGAIENYEAAMLAMLNWQLNIDDKGREQPHLLKLSPGAYKEWHAFARAVEAQMLPGEPLEHYTDLAGKLPGAAVRLAGVLHGAEHAHGEPWNTPITAATMGNALKLAAVFLRHGMAAMTLMGADPELDAAQTAWRWIERRRMERFSPREMFRGLQGSSAFSRMDGVRKALALLKERGYVIITEPPRDGPGRPASPEVVVRPSIAERWQ